MITIPQINRLVNYLYGKDSTELSILVPDKFYIGLSTSEIDSDGVIKGEISTQNTGYQRIEITNDKSHFTRATAPNNGVVANTQAITWPISQTSWGTIKSIFITSNATPTQGEYALYVTTTNIPVGAGVNLYYEVGALKFTISAGE